MKQVIEIKQSEQGYVLYKYCSGNGRCFIDEKINEIKLLAFFDFEKLEFVYIPSTVKLIGSLAFPNIDSVCIYCEHESEPAEWRLINWRGNLTHVYWNCKKNKHFIYNIVNDKISVLKYLGNETDVVVPDYIDGYEVCGIESYAFCNKSKIKSVVLSKGIVRLYTKTFVNCDSIEGLLLTSSNLLDSNSSWRIPELLSKGVSPKEIVVYDDDFCYGCDPALYFRDEYSVDNFLETIKSNRLFDIYISDITKNKKIINDNGFSEIGVYCFPDYDKNHVGLSIYPEEVITSEVSKYEGTYLVFHIDNSKLYVFAKNNFRDIRTIDGQETMNKIRYYFDSFECLRPSKEELKEKKHIVLGNEKLTIHFSAFTDCISVILDDKYHSSSDYKMAKTYLFK